MKHNAKKRTLRLEQLENRALLSATTWDNAAQADAAVAAEMAATLNETAPIDLTSAFSAASLEATATEPWVVTDEDSLRQAVDKAKDGGVITFAPNLGAITLDSTLEITKNITIDGGESGITIITPTGIHGVCVEGALRSVRIKNVVFGGEANGALVVSEGATAIVSGCEFRENATSVILDNGHLKSSGNLYYHHISAMIDASNNSTLHLLNDVVDGDTDGNSLVTLAGSSSATIVHSTLVAEGTLALNNSSATVQNSILIGAVSGKGGSLVAQNVLKSDAYWNSKKVSIDSTNVTVADPTNIFVDYEGDDFNIKKESPAIDAGNNAYAVDHNGNALLTDIAGNNRIAGNSVDVGAYEYGSDPYVDTTPLNAPTLTAEALGSSKIELTFDNLDSNASGYVYQFSTTDGAWSEDAWVSAELSETGTLTVDGLAANTTYYFVAKAVGTGDYVDSEVSVSANATTEKAALEAPSITAIASGTTITLTIGEVEGAVGYVYEWATNADFTDATSVDATAGTFAVEGWNADTTYYFRATAIADPTANDNSPVSNSAFATTIPNAPSDVAFGADGFLSDQRYVGRDEYNFAFGTLTWTDNSSTETVFRVEYSADGETWKTGEVAANATGQVSVKLLDLEQGAEYVVRVCAVNEAGASAYAETEFLTQLAAPSDLTITNYDRVAETGTLSWKDNARGETRYEVKSFKPWSQKWGVVGIYDADATSRTCTSIYWGESFHYQVRAVNLETGAVSDWVGLEFDTNYYTDAPESATISNYNPLKATATFSWTPVENAVEYQVQSLSPTTGQWRTVGSYDAATTSRLCTMVTPGETYRYRVRALSSVGVSAWVEDELVTSDALPAPETATISNYDPLKATATFSWAAVEGAVEYQVQSMSPTTGEWRAVGSYDGAATSRVCTMVTPGETYRYRVRAIYADGFSAWVEDELVTSVALPAPEFVKIEGYDRDASTATLVWSSMEGAIGYEARSFKPWTNAWGMVGRYDANTTSRVCSSLSYGGSYHYQVRAIYENGYSDWVGVEFIANESLNGSTEGTDAVSAAFADFFAEGVEDDFWFELEESLGKRRK